MDIFKSRWIDLYLLRYGPATILGAMILGYFYSIRHSFGINVDIPNDNFLLVSIFGLGGFLYAYIASAPILVSHCARFLTSDPHCSRLFAVCWSGAQVLLLLLSWLRFGFAFHDVGKGLIYAVPYSLWIVVWVAACITYFRRETVYEYYKTICSKRTADNAEFVESYRTLREHGNAFQIMFWEMILAALIYVTFKTQELDSADGVFWVSLILGLFWIGPAVLTWSIACRLEGDFARDPDI